MIVSLLTIAVTLAWYIPFYLAQKDRLKTSRYLAPFLVGTLPMFVVIVLLQVLSRRLFYPAGQSAIVKMLFTDIVEAAFIEETIKGLLGILFTRKLSSPRRSDYILIFGAVGLGYELIESLALTGSVISSLARGITACHMVWQFHMGYHLYDSEASSKAKAFLVPMLMHFLFDFGTDLLLLSENEAYDNFLPLIFLAFIAIIAATATFAVRTCRKCYRAIKAERSNDEQTTD